MTRWYETVPPEARSSIQRYQKLLIVTLRDKPPVSFNQVELGTKIKTAVNSLPVVLSMEHIGLPCNLELL